MNIYGLSDNDKILSPSNKDFIFSSVLSDLYSNPIKNYDGESFQLIVETIKEEASESEEVLIRDQWQLISKENGLCSNHNSIEKVLKVEWGYV